MSSWVQTRPGSVLINGTDISSALLSYEVDQVYKTYISSGSIVVGSKRLAAIMSLPDTAVIDIYRNYTYNGGNVQQHIFSGEIKDHSVTKGKLTINIQDKLVALTRAYISKVYGSDAPIKMSDVLIDIITSAGLNADTSSIADSGSITVSGLTYAQYQAYQACTDLITAAAWNMYYDPRDDKVHAGPIGQGSAVVTFRTGDNVSGVPKWTEDRTQIYNDVTVVSANVEQDASESFTLTAAGAQGLLCAHLADSITSVSYVDGGGVSHALYANVAPDTNTSGDYYTTKQTSPSGQSVTSLYIFYNHVTGAAPAIGEIYVIAYKFGQAYAVRMIDAASQATYDPKAHQFPRSDLTAEQDCGAACVTYLQAYKAPIEQVDLSMLQGPPYYCWIGELANIIDTTSNNRSENNMVITKLTLYWPKKYDGVELGELLPLTADYMRGIENRLAALEANTASVPPTPTGYTTETLTAENLTVAESVTTTAVPYPAQADDVQADYCEAG